MKVRMKRALVALRDVGSAFAACFLPQTCALCQRRVESSQLLCCHCHASLKTSRIVFCPICRFEGDEDSGVGHCSAHDFVEARAALPADKAVLSLVHQFKYHGRRELAPVLAELMVRAGIIDRDLAGYDVLCPVPLFRTRERERGFNQSTELASCIETASGVPLVAGLLARVQSTREQAKLPAELRRRNLLESFAVPRASLAAGKSIVLVDDVITTGSTVAACIRALRESGVDRVLVVAVAA
jgi:ComF family protein